MIGKDFDPINFTLFGLNLTDPMDFVYDIILGVLSLFFAYKAYKLRCKGDFVVAWQRFFLFFGLATFLSAFAHLFYNYFYYYGKIAGWLLIPFSIFWIEKAMINAHWNKTIKAKGNRAYFIKLMVLYTTFIAVWVFVDVYAHPPKLFLPIAINTILGLIIGVGIFSFQFQKKISQSFRFIFYGILVVIPSAFVFLLKINIHPFLTKNDISHILMIFAVSFFYFGFTQITKEKHPFITAK